MGKPTSMKNCQPKGFVLDSVEEKKNQIFETCPTKASNQDKKILKLLNLTNEIQIWVKKKKVIINQELVIRIFFFFRIQNSKRKTLIV